MRKYKCQGCGFVYDPQQGIEEDGFPPGTPFESIPMEWTCGECGADKADFQPLDG
ncbi:rubredoxin [Myxococcaceae bacterium JPH2]|nr:rubredoxin [Myxococcaceae bacterium JPH2]